MRYYYYFSESPGSQTLEQFRTLVATEVFEMLIPNGRRVEERMTKIEEDLGNLTEVMKLEQKATVDLKLLKRLLTPPQ